MYENVLIKAGLNEKQAKTYLACLELGEAKVPAIARKAEVKRTTTYGILDELSNLGFVNYTEKGGNKLFRAEHPRTIVQLLEQRKNQIQQIIPDLENIFATHNLRPQVQFFEGTEGIKRIYENTLQCVSKKLYQIVKVKDFIDFPGKNFSEDYIKRRIAKGITAYALHPKSGDIYSNIYGRQDEKLKRLVRYLPPNMFYASMIMIYDNKVAMISTKKERSGFIIESKEFTNTIRSYFDFMWNVGSKEPDG